MNTPDATSDFFTPFYHLKKHCEESIFNIQRTIDEKNIEMLQLIHANSLDTKDRVVQFKIQDVLFAQTRRNLFNMALNVSKHVLFSYLQFETFPEDFLFHLETTLWLLQNLGNTFDLQELRSEITLAYGEEKLAELEEFNNIDPLELENEAQPHSETSFVEEYTKNIQEMLLPWVNKTPVAHSKTMPMPDQKPILTIKNYQVVEEIKHRESPGLRLNLHNNNSRFKSIVTERTISSKGSVRGGGVPTRGGFLTRASTVTSTILKPEEECMINTSSSFDFNHVTSNLKISTIKGLCKKNLEYFDQIEPQLIKDGAMFEDLEFAPDINSLTLNVAEFPIAEKVIWRRLKDIFPGSQLSICSEKIGPNDIQQGQLGACYLLSALSVLSEQKGFIKRLFHSKSLCEAGCYSIWLCDSGEWKNIIIDDYIPCVETPDNKVLPYFSKSKSNDIWVMLLEKAFAKLFGNYHNIDGGCLSEAMSVLTGAPTKFFKEKNNGKPFKEQLWAFLKESIQSNFPVTAASRGESLIFSSAHKNTKHIVSDHAYAVLEIKEIQCQESKGSSILVHSSYQSEYNSIALSAEGSEYVEKSQELKTERLIKIRNPWGISLPGEEIWGQRSQFWTSKMDESLGGSLKDEGAFWMNLNDFASHFKFVCACEIHDDYYFSFIRLGETKGSNYFVAKMNVETTSFVYLSVQQKLQKHFRKNDSYQYSPGRVLVGQLDSKGKIVSIVAGKCKGAQSIVIKEKFAKGEYLILIEMEWIQKFYNELVVTAYSKTKVNFTEEPTSNHDLNTLYESFIRAIINTSSAAYLSKQYELEDKPVQMWKFKIEKYGLVCLLYLNKEKEIALNLKLEVQRLENMVLAVPSFKDGKYIHLKVKPNSLKLVLFKTKYKDILENKSQEEYRKISDNEGYAYEYGELSKLSNVYTTDELKELCKERGAEVLSLKNGQIVVYRFKYLGGLAEYYMNNDKTTTFKQSVKFEVQNVLVNDASPQDMQIVVKPQSDFLLDLKVKDLLKKGVFTRTTEYSLI